MGELRLVEWIAAGDKTYNPLLRNSKVKLLMEEAAEHNHSTHQLTQKKHNFSKPNY